MVRKSLCGLVLLALGLLLWSQPAAAQPVEARVAFVVGNSGYARGPLPTALNDAGLVAEALRSIGFEVVEGADLNQTDLLRSYRDFLGKVEAGGPDTVAFVYFSGYGLAFEGDNFLLSTDTRIERESDIPLQALRLSDLIRSLAGAPARAKIFVADASRALPFAPQGARLAPGLAALEAPDGMLVAMAAAPGTVAPDGGADYGPYATAIAEMVRDPGLDLDAVFTRIRTRTHQLTEGRQTPWHVSALAETVTLVPAEAVQAAGAPPPPPLRIVRETRPMRDIGMDEAYAMAIELDTLDGYAEFVEDYPRSPYARRVYAIIRARREALAWLRARDFDTPQSYWTYLQRYPDGIYAFDARRRLRRLNAAFDPPPGFAMLEFGDVPPPLADEPRDYIGFEPGPPPPLLLIEPPSPFFRRLPPPPAIRRGPSQILPIPVPFPVIPQVAPAQRRPTATFQPLVPPPAGTPATRRRPPGAPSRGAVPPTGTRTLPTAPAAPVAPLAPARSATPPTTTPTPPPGRGTPPAPGTATPPPGRPTPPAPGATTPSPPATLAPTPGRPTPPRPGVTPPSGAGAPPPGAGAPPRPTPPAPATTTPPSRTAPPPSAKPAPSSPPAAKPAPPPPRVAPPAPPAAKPAPPPPPAAKPAPLPPRVAPPPPPTAKPTPPPPRVAPPPPPAAKPAPPPPPAAKPVPPAAKPPACPAGKTMQVVNGQPVCK